MREPWTSRGFASDLPVERIAEFLSKQRDADAVETPGVLDAFSPPSESTGIDRDA